MLFVGDPSVERSLRPLGMLPAELDPGPHLIAAIREAMTVSGGDITAAGPVVQQRLTAWAEWTADGIAELVGERDPAMVLTSLFGVEVPAMVAPACPWAVINSTFLSVLARRGRRRRTSERARFRW
jgi:hypothetical protein